MTKHTLTSTPDRPGGPRAGLGLLLRCLEPRTHHAPLDGLRHRHARRGHRERARPSTTPSGRSSGSRSHWRTLIDEVEAPHRFRDVQEKGPYKSWVHEHRFTAVEGGVRMDDQRRVRDAVRAARRTRAPISSCAPSCEHIFDFRATAIDSIFEPAGDRCTAADARHHRRRRRHRLRGRRDRPRAAPSRTPRRRPLLPGRGRTRPAARRRRDADRRHPRPRQPAARARTVSTSWSSRWPSRACPSNSPSKGYTFVEVDAGGTERLDRRRHGEPGSGGVVYLSGAGAGHDARRHWFRAKAVAEDAVRGSGMTLDHPATHLGLRSGRRLAQPLPRLRSHACRSCP